MYNVSTMEEGGFEWDSFNIEHIKQHRVSPSEAEQVITNDPLYPPENPQTVDGEVRWIVYGQTEQFRCLVVIYTDRCCEWLLHEAEDDEYQAYGVTEENDDD